MSTRSRLFRSTVLTFPLLALVAFACNPDPDSAPGDDDAGTIDTGTPFDGGPNDGGPTTTDGGAPVDGSTPAKDAGTGTDGSVSAGAIDVKVIYQDLTVEVGADVYWFEEGQPVFHAKTDATGSASHGVSHPTSVTVLRHTTEYVGYHEIVTVLAAMPGDHVTVGNEGSPPVASVATVNANIPTSAGYSGATAYGEDMGDCISGQTTQTSLPVTADFVASSCYKVGDTATVLVSAGGSSGLLAYASKPATLASGGTTITFDSSDWKPVTAPKAMTFTGTPPTDWARSVGAGVRFADAVGANYALQSGYANAPTDLTTLSVSYVVPPLSSAVLRSAFYASGSLGLVSFGTTTYRHGLPTDTITFDYGQMLPRISAPLISSATTNAPTTASCARSWGPPPVSSRERRCSWTTSSRSPSRWPRWPSSRDTFCRSLSGRRRASACSWCSS